MSDNKQQILETITAVSRLVLLAFKPHGTKIAIRSHNIIICDPSPDTRQNKSLLHGLEQYLTLPQSVDRYLNGDSRDDIYVLNCVICNFIQLYILPYKTLDYTLYKKLINLSKYMCCGLKELQSTYGYGTVVGCLQYYIVVLTAVINDTFYPDMLYCIKYNEKKSFLDTGQDKNQDKDSKQSMFDIEKIKNFWSKDELYSLCNQFDQCFCLENESEQIIFNTENDLSGINIDKINESTKPKSINNVIVQGHLVGISNILNMMDRRFNLLLEQSIKG